MRNSKEHVPQVSNNKSCQNKTTPAIYPSWWGQPGTIDHIAQTPRKRLNDKENIVQFDPSKYKYQPYTTEISYPVAINKPKEFGKEQKQAKIYLTRGGGNTKINKKPLEQKKNSKMPPAVPSYLKHVESKIKKIIEIDRQNFADTSVVKMPNYRDREEDNQIGVAEYSQQELPTLGRKEGSVIKMADQCLASSIVNRFSQEIESQALIKCVKVLNSCTHKIGQLIKETLMLLLQ